MQLILTQPRQSLRPRKPAVHPPPVTEPPLPVTLTEIVNAPPNPHNIVLLGNEKRDQGLPQVLPQYPNPPSKRRRPKKIGIPRKAACRRTKTIPSSSCAPHAPLHIPVCRHTLFPSSTTISPCSTYFRSISCLIFRFSTVSNTMEKS